MWNIVLVAVSSFIITVSTIHGIDYVRRRYALTPVDSFDMEGLLRSKNLWDMFKSDEIKCAGCGNVISFANLGTVAEDEHTGEIELICRKPACLGTYIESIEALMWGSSDDAS